MNCKSRCTGKSGQALIESTLIVALLCLIFFGAFQLSQLFVAREVMDHAATAVARARSVGFNDFMVYKVGRVAAIPNAGRMTYPEVETSSGGLLPVATAIPGDLWDTAMAANPVSPQYAIESALIPLYLGAEWGGQLPAILDYNEWDSVDMYVNEIDEALARGRTTQDYPLRFPFHRAFYAGDEVRIEGDSRLANHYPLYLE
ncbi:MAG: pilus assembly protein [Verrucomicrobia bacterium]|nr:pilus assembly protein [Verrucomicrobiota bacterium]